MKNARPNNADKDKETFEEDPMTKSSISVVAQSVDIESGSLVCDSSIVELVF